MSKKMNLIAKANIPIRTKRSTAKSSVSKRDGQDDFVAKGDEITIVDAQTLKGVKYGELQDGNFVIIERDGIANFE